MEAREILCDEIGADHFLIAVDQALGDWPRHAVRGKASAVQGAHAADAQTCRGQKTGDVPVLVENVR